ncbi:hypothetical protein [uncultured Ezakiella sp.]|uniref:hypothetical protein n=1 Tax=uncultured Ezakiella sp. TaxID=1637529 RepID=UPI0025DA03EA|nr:hypothetical protein [uncultured Ezakiella sp.]
MTNMKRHYLRSTLALIMSVLMVVTMLPLNVFAEVEPANWVDDAKTARYWPIPNQGRIVKVSPAEPLKNPSIRYIGGYTRPDGREVIRLAFSGYQGALTDVWERMILKPDADFNELIDWTESGMGRELPKQGINNHDRWSYNDVFIKFKPLSADQGGSGNLHVMDLGYSGTKTVKTGSLGSHYEVPIDLVMKEGATVKNLDTNQLVQMRLTDDKYERIYSTTIEDNKEVPYSSYTMSTFVPVRVDLKQGILNTDVVRNYEDVFQSASNYIKYNEEKGYIDVFTRRTAGSVGSQADVGGSMNAGDSRNKGNYGFMQTFDDSFVDILKPQDESGTVAQIFITDDNDKIKYPSADPDVPKPANRIDYSINDITKKDGVGMVEVTNNNSTKTFLWGSPTLTTYGYSTVVRYFIDKDKLKEKFGDTDIVSYEFFSTLFATNQTGVEEFKSVPRDEDIDLKRGDTIDILFDGRRDLITLGTFDNEGSFIQIGDDQFKLSLRTTGDKSKYTGGLITSRPEYMRKMTFTVPFDIKIKKDTPVTIFSRKTKLQKVSPGMTVTFNYSDMDDSGNTITKKKTYRFERPLVDGYTRNEKGEVYKGETKINNPNDSLFIDNKLPLMTSRQENFGGGILTRTADAPDVDEIFTDSEALTGRSKYDRVNVYLYNADKQKVDTAKRLGTITASDEKIKMNVNGDDVQGFEWTSASNDEEHEIESSVWARKDTPLFFTNQDVLSGSLESKDPVVEQVQAKVTFDLNGGTLPLEVKSYQGTKDDALPGTEFAYVVKRSEETEKLVRIAPMNEKFANQAGYVANGFEGAGATTKDHNGGELAGDALALRKFAEEPSKPNLEFYGWTTQKVDTVEEFEKLDELTTQDQAVEVVAKEEAAKLKEEIDDLKKDAAALRAKGGTSIAKKRNEKEAQELDDQREILEARYNQVKDLASNKVYKFTKTSPIVSTMTVYAFYGPKKSAAYKGEQKYDEKEDKQYIDATPEDPDKTASSTATYTLVKKTGEDADGNPTYTTVITSTENKDGKPIFDISGDDIVDGGEYYIETKDGDKAPSYSKVPVVVDKKGPEATEEIKAEPDLFNYKVALTGKAVDEKNNILKAIVEANGQKVDVTSTINGSSIVLNDDTLKQLGEAKEYKVTIYDAMGNKLEKTLTVDAVEKEIELRLDTVRAEDSSILLKSKNGAELTIRVIRNKKPIILDKVTAESDEIETIDLKQGEAEFKLQEKDRIIIDAKLSGYKDARIMQLVTK